MRLRRYQSEYIGSLVKWLSIYRPVVQEFKDLVECLNPQFVQDLCSGSGIPAIYMQEHVATIPNSILSDKFPDLKFSPTLKINYLKTPVDVLQLDPQPGVVYSMYNALHHFTDDEKLMLIIKMRNKKNGFLFAEILQPDLLTMIKVIFSSTLLQLLTAAFVKPFSLSRLFFTYIIPVNIITVLYDGIISVMKARSSKQYATLLNELSSAGYNISVGKCGSWKATIVFIKGMPA